MALASLLPFQGPKKSRFSGPTPSNPPRNDVAPLKIIIIMYRAIKTTSTLIVIFEAVLKLSGSEVWFLMTKSQKNFTVKIFKLAVKIANTFFLNL
jgi:hypothetical protein